MKGGSGEEKTAHIWVMLHDMVKFGLSLGAAASKCRL